MKRQRKGFTLVELLVVIVIIGILAALLLPAIAKAIRNSKLTRCVNNQSQLWKMMANYVVQFGGQTKDFPSGGNWTGSKFWYSMQTTTPPLVDTTLAAIFFCPLSGNPVTSGASDYQGPLNNVNKYNDSDPVGADKATNHTNSSGVMIDGNVVRKSYDTTTCIPTDTLWTSLPTYVGP